MAGRPKRCGFFARGDEYVFPSFADFETALAGRSGERFETHSDDLAPPIVAGSPNWGEIFRIVE